MNQCFRAAETMFGMQLSPPMMPAFKSISVGDPDLHAPKRQAVMSPTESVPHLTPRGAGLPSNVSSVQPISTQPANIQPRRLPNGHPTPSVSLSGPAPIPATATTTTTSHRKRGRPSKADKEARARANTPQSTGYAPITPAPAPAPIAPLPVPPAVLPAAHSPVSSSASTYPFSPGTTSESKGRKRPRTSTADSHGRSESVTRSAQGTTSPESTDQQYPGLGHEYRGGWPENTHREDRRPSTGHPVHLGPVPLEPPIQSQQPGPPHGPGLQPTRSPRPPLFVAGAHHTPPSTTSQAMKHVKTDSGHARVVNRA